MSPVRLPVASSMGHYLNSPSAHPDQITCYKSQCGQLYHFIQDTFFSADPSSVAISEEVNLWKYDLFRTTYRHPSFSNTDRCNLRVSTWYNYRSKPTHVTAPHIFFAQGWLLLHHLSHLQCLRLFKHFDLFITHFLLPMLNQSKISLPYDYLVTSLIKSSKAPKGEKQTLRPAHIGPEVVGSETSTTSWRCSKMALLTVVTPTMPVLSSVFTFSIWFHNL